MTSHFDAFSFKKFSEVNLETAEICSSREAALLANVRMSSACRKLPAVTLAHARRGLMTSQAGLSH